MADRKLKRYSYFLLYEETDYPEMANYSIRHLKCQKGREISKKNPFLIGIFTFTKDIFILISKWICKSMDNYRELLNYHLTFTRRNEINISHLNYHFMQHVDFSTSLT